MDEAVSLSRLTRLGWLVLSGGIAGGVCRDCKRGMTFMGSTVLLFFVIMGVAWLIHALAGAFK